MPSKSLLEMETAIQRIAELDQERQGLSDLIQKLKNIRDSMTTLQDETEEKKSETKKWLEDLKHLVSQISEETIEARQRLEQIVTSFEQQSKSLLSWFSSSSQELLKKGDEILNNISNKSNEIENILRKEIDDKFEKVGDEISSFMADCYNVLDDSLKSNEKIVEDACNRVKVLEHNTKDKLIDFEKDFEDFKDKHIKALEQVSKSYERMRVNYDTIRDGLQTMEDSIENIQNNFLKTVKLMNNKHQRIKTSLEEILRKIWNKIKENNKAEFNRIQEQLEGRLVKISNTLDKLSTEINQKELSYRRTIRFIWVGILLGIFLGGASLSILLFGSY